MGTGKFLSYVQKALLVKAGRVFRPEGSRGELHGRRLMPQGELPQGRQVRELQALRGQVVSAPGCGKTIMFKDQRFDQLNHHPQSSNVMVR